MVLGLRQGLSDHRHQCGVFSTYPCQSAFNGQRKGLQFDGTNFAWAFPAKTQWLLTKGGEADAEL
jgi:hypothetical protein